MPRQTDLLIEALDREVERVVTQLSLQVVHNVVPDTPVDTGWARTNWVPSIGASFNQTAGTREQAEGGSLDQSSQQQGTAEVATSYRLSRGLVFISNNVPYIVDLNEGTSRQAPAAFVQSAIARAISQVQNQ